MYAEKLNQGKTLFSFIKNYAKKHVSPWISVPVVLLLSAPLFCVVFLFGFFILLEVLPMSMPLTGFGIVFAIVFLFSYFVLLILWLVFAKNKSLTNFFYDAIPFLFLGAVLYFWWNASSWEGFLSDDWSKYPELSNLSALLTYSKAMAKTIMLGSVVIVFRLYFKRKA